MNMLSLFPAIPVLMMLGLWLSKSARQVRAVMVAGSSLLLALAVVLAGLGSCAEQEEDEKPRKERQPQKKQAADRRKAG